MLSESRARATLVRGLGVRGVQDFARSLKYIRAIFHFYDQGREVMPGTQFHGVPFEERASDGKGGKLPYALEYPAYKSFFPAVLKYVTY